MKRLFSLLLVLGLAVQLMFISSASAASGSVSFSSNPKEVLVGKTYTIKYSVKFSSACTGSYNVTVGGAFEKVSGGDSGWHDTIPNNTTKSYSGSVKVRVKSGTVGQTGTIKVSGKALEYKDGNVGGEKSFSRTHSSKVVSQLSSTPKPKSTPKPSATAKPDEAEPDVEAEFEMTETAPPTEWELLSSRIGTLEQGGTLSFAVTQMPQIPKDVLEALREKKGILEVDFGTYFCTINGAELGPLPEDLQVLDLSVSMVKNPALSTAAGGEDIYQLHFAHSGALPGCFSYRFLATEHVPGQTVYLYYYYEDSGVIEGKQEATVDMNGYVTFNIYHCSSYFVASAIMEGAAGILAAPQEPEDTDALIASAVEAALLEAKASAPPAFSIPALVAALSGALLLGIFVTLLTCRAGPFKKKPGRHAQEPDISID